MQTFDIIRYAVTPPPTGKPENDRRAKQRRVDRLWRALGYKSSKYFEKWLRESGDGYGQTGERNLLDRLELMVREIWEFCPVAVTMILVWFIGLYNDLMNKESAPIPEIDLHRELNETARVLLNDPPSKRQQLMRLRSLIDRELGCDIAPVVATAPTVEPPVVNYFIERQKLIEAQLNINKEIREKSIKSELPYALEVGK